MKMKKRTVLQKTCSMAVCMLCTLCMLLMTACADNGRGKPGNQNEEEQAFQEAKAAGRLSGDENTIMQESKSKLEKNTEEKTGKQTEEAQMEAVAENTGNTGISQSQENADPGSTDSTKGKAGKNNSRGNSNPFSNSQKTTSEKNSYNNKKDNLESDPQGTSNSNYSSGKFTESQGNSANTSPDSSKKNPTNISSDDSTDISATIPSTPTADAPPSHTVCTWDSGRILEEATCTEAGRKLYTCTQCGKEKEERIPATGHRMEEQWFGEMPSCDRGSYLNIVCSVCGFVQSSESVPALGCVSDAGEELFHGNCREETIVVYHCIRCGRETGFDRHYESDEHDWITARTDPEWDEEAFDFVSREVTCCSRCGIEKGAQ